MRTRAKSRLRWASTIAIVAMTIALLPSTAFALTCGTLGNYHVGAAKEPSSGQIYGAWAEINVRAANLCTGDVTASSAWSMIAEDGTGGWIQVGYEKNAQYGRVSFTQVYKGPGDGTPNTDFFSAVTLDSKWGYKSRILGDGYGYLYKCDVGASNSNCVQYKKTSWQPFNFWNGSHAEYAGETFHQQTDIPGTSSFRTNFEALQEIKGSGSWYVEPYFGTKNCCTPYRMEVVSNSHFRIWTQR